MAAGAVEDLGYRLVVVEQRLGDGEVMANRKEWELTDEELDAVAQGIPIERFSREVATAAARKALEWAADRVAPLPDVEPTNQWERGFWAGENVSASLIRKELTDG